MMDIFCIGADPEDSFSRMFNEAGLKIVPAKYKRGVLENASTCGAVVLHWKSKRDQKVIEEAKMAGIPVLVVTSKLAAAYRAGEPSADVYLELPTNQEELVSLSIDLAKTREEKFALANAATVS
jgi:hypothetical protein